MGRPGLDPGTLGLKGTVLWLLCVGLVENSLCFNENRVVSCRSGLVVLQKYEAYIEVCSDLVTRNCPVIFKFRLLWIACGFTSGLRHQEFRIVAALEDHDED